MANNIGRHTIISALAIGLFAAGHADAQITLLATGTLDQSRAGSFADLSGLKYKLENGAPANLLGGIGSAIAYSGGNTFLALPDRGPNAISYDAAIEDTASYVSRFHTIEMKLRRNETGFGLPFTLVPELRHTTLLWSFTPLVYGTGAGDAVPPAAPPINNIFQHFFTGRSDNFDPRRNSGDQATRASTQKGYVCRTTGAKFTCPMSTGPTSTSSTA